MSGTSTSRLVIEGIVEGLETYRWHKEDTTRRRHQRHHRKCDRQHEGNQIAGNQHRHRPSADISNHKRRLRRHDHQRQHNQQSRHDSDNNLESSETQYLMSGALHTGEAHAEEAHAEEAHAEEAHAGEGHAEEVYVIQTHTRETHIAEFLLGPDGTPFGFLPTRNSGMGFLPHAKAVYRHVKAEQDAGFRGKGPAEKWLNGFLPKKSGARAMKRDNGKELLAEKDNEAESTGGNRRQPNGRRTSEAHPPLQGARPVLRPVPLASHPLQLPTEGAHDHRDGDGAAGSMKRALAADRVQGSRSQDAPPAPIVHFQSPSPPKEKPTIRLLTPMSDATLPSALITSHSAAPSKAVFDAGKKVARQEEAQPKQSHWETPAYEAPPQSNDVEALERAQVAEEEVRREEAGHAGGTRTPLTAPQPRMTFPTNFQAEVLAKVRLLDLTEKPVDDAPAVHASQQLHTAEASTLDEIQKTDAFDRGTESRTSRGEVKVDLHGSGCVSSDFPMNGDTGAQVVGIHVWGKPPGWDFNNLHERTGT